MRDTDRERLRAIKTFPSLVRYLKDELDWPIETDDFEDLTFDYEPEELGIDPETAVKIDKIKQLRPITANQPWGIFFINFKPKRLPVVVLRRILSQLVIKKRASGSRAERAAWDLNDLLFISNYGEDDQRQMTFANFSRDTGISDLPTLRVLGWDDADTALHIDHVHQELKQKLHWPDNESDLEGWRALWSSAFVLRHREVIRTSQELAIRLADLARSIRKRANHVLAIETEQGPLRKLHKAFQEALIHDLNEDDFADMYAQTIAYGLFAARISRPMGITADNVSDMVPITNPFLKEMLSTFLTAGGRKGGIDFDELGIQEVVDVLNSPETHIDAVLRDFGNRTRGEDPVIHFYELFLSEYDRQKKIKRGVFFTPLSVVSYIVSSVHESLQTEFGLEDGLADIATWGEMAKRNRNLEIPDGTSLDEPFVQILDPAAGTGTFLIEVIDVIHKTVMDKWQKEGYMLGELEEKWNEYVPKHLLPRLYGFELLMAPYAIAHMKIGLKLFETGYRFGSDERVRVYITNSLEPDTDASLERVFEQWSPSLAHEAQAVNAIKRNQRFTVIIGNPPYSKASANKGKWIAHLMESYKQSIKVEETQRQALSDDYAKFIRFAHWRIEQIGCGIVGLITNHSYLDGLLFRDMRKALLDTFSEIYILRLHGDSRVGEFVPDGNKDENVFDIQQGVAISILIKGSQQSQSEVVYHSDMWGTRESKYSILLNSDINTTKWEKIHPEPPYYFFTPFSRNLNEEYDSCVALPTIFGTGNPQKDAHVSYGAGFVTQQDKFAIGFEPEILFKNIDIFLEPSLTRDELQARFHFCSTNQWNFEKARRELKDLDLSGVLKKCLYRPFDYRFTLYHKHVATILRMAIMRNFDKHNLALLTTRRVTHLPFNNFFVANSIVEYKAVSHDRNTMVFPLYLYPPEKKIQLFTGRHHNLNPTVIKKYSAKIGLKFIEDGKGDLEETFGPEDIFHYAYAVFHSPTYRTRYAEFLKIDFPRLPLTSDKELFKALIVRGAKLVSLHLMESPELNKLITKYPVPGSSTVEKVTYDENIQRVYINKTQYFEGVPQDIWNFHIGGYQVLEKWLKDRRGRVLSEEDITHYQRVIVALNETIRIMAEIDHVIEQHGGWPGAFVQD